MDSHREIRILQALEKIADGLTLIAEILMEKEQKGRSFSYGREEVPSQEVNED